MGILTPWTAKCLSGCLFYCLSHFTYPPTLKKQITACLLVTIDRMKMLYNAFLNREMFSAFV